MAVAVGVGAGMESYACYGVIEYVGFESGLS